MLSTGHKGRLGARCSRWRLGLALPRTGSISLASSRAHFQPSGDMAQVLLFGAPLSSGGCTAARQPTLLRPARDRRRQHMCAANGVAAGPAAAAAATAATSTASTAFMRGLAVVVGWLVIAGSCVRSLPQILRIVKNRSVEGLSLTSFTSELVAYTIQVAYNLAYKYPFSTYGDLVMCWLQNVAILGLMFVHGAIPGPTKACLVVGFLGLCSFLFAGRCSMETLQVLQASTVVLLALGGRVPQILMNIKRGNSGELSMISTGLSLAGNLARVLTTAVLVKDGIILASASTQALLNFILLCQTIDTARRMGGQLRPA